MYNSAEETFVAPGAILNSCKTFTNRKLFFNSNSVIFQGRIFFFIPSH